MKFIIEPSGMLNAIEKRIYKKDKWKPIRIQSSYGIRNLYTIEINNMAELLEMCEDYHSDFTGILIQPISGYLSKELEESGLSDQYKYEITCYNSWIE